MREYKISVRQICFSLVAFSLAIKMIMLTAVTASISGRMLWLSAIINFAVDGLFILYILKISEKFDGLDFYEILEVNIGKVGAKIVFALYAIIFFVKAYIPILEQKTFIEITLYEMSPTILTFMPFFIFSAYFCFKGMRAIGRCADIAVWLTVLAVLGLIALTLQNADFSELLPLADIPLTDVLSGGIKTSLWYFDSLYILFFIGHFKREKLTKTKILGAFAIEGLMIAVFTAATFAEFGVLTERQFFAPVKVGLFSVATLNIGRIDYIAAFVIATSNVFAIAVPLVFCTYCVNKVIGVDGKVLTPVIINAIMAALILFTEKYLYVFFGFISGYAVYAFAFFAYVVPLIMLFLKKGSIKR